MTHTSDKTENTTMAATHEFNHPHGKVERSGREVTLHVLQDDGRMVVREQRAYVSPERADLAFWDAVSWLRGL